ncbi:MAG: hypothetical protein CMI31_09930 [Opitutae bacterium]|nr:hypothetical protein [Opitutae bacterium]|tara:strand:- start:3225 stop:3878 length:654 start_codon:yes stop_codon:yes gene_type:complete
MKIAVMQPYFCPYLGYFQLVNAVDLFVFYDDVQYIKRGFVNRNTLKNEFKFTIPVSNASTKLQLNEVLINWDNVFFKDFAISLRHLYSKSMNFDAVSSILNDLFQSKPETISQLAIDSITSFSQLLGVTTQFKRSSELEYEKTENRALNLINICKAEDCDHYINSIGGMDLYLKEFFLGEGIMLNFLEPAKSLSIIDVCMKGPLNEVSQELDNFKLI